MLLVAVAAMQAANIVIARHGLLPDHAPKSVNDRSLLEASILDDNDSASPTAAASKRVVACYQANILPSVAVSFPLVEGCYKFASLLCSR